MPSSEIIKIWYRSVKPDGTVWCESSNPNEVLEMSEPDCTLQMLEVIQIINDWKPWRVNTEPIVITVRWAYVGYRAFCGEENCRYVSHQHREDYEAARCARDHCVRNHGTDNVKIVHDKKEKK